MSKDLKKDICPRCGLKEVTTETKRKHPIMNAPNINTHDKGDYMKDTCGFCGWYSQMTWNGSSFTNTNSSPPSKQELISLELKVKKHKKLQDRTTTRKRSRPGKGGE